MDTNLLKYQAFVTTVQCGSFTKAGELMQYSQSGISRMIHDLEKEWQICLLERGKGKVRLTPDGEQLFACAKSICDDCERMQARILELKGMNRGVLRFGTLPGTAEHCLPPLLCGFSSRFPLITFETMTGDSSEIESWVDEGVADCGITALPTEKDLENIFLDQDPIMAVLPPEHPLAAEKKFPVSELTREKLLLFEKAGAADGAARTASGEIARLLEQCGISIAPRLKSRDPGFLLSMAASGMGIALMPGLLLKDIRHRVAVRELDIPACRNLGLVFRGGDSAGTVVKEFLDFVTAGGQL